MSRKNSPSSNEQGFGDLEEDFFNSAGGGWGEPADDAAAKAKAAEEARLAAEAEARRKAEAEARAAEERRKAEEARLAEEARVAAERQAAEEARLAAERKAAEEARIAAERSAEEARLAAVAEAERVAEEARVAAAAEAARIAEEARLAEERRQAETSDSGLSAAEQARRDEELELEARLAARGMKDQATRIFRRKTKEEVLAEEDAEDALESGARASVRIPSSSRSTPAEVIPDRSGTTLLPEEPVPPPAVIPDPAADVQINIPAVIAIQDTVEIEPDPTSAELISLPDTPPVLGSLPPPRPRATPEAEPPPAPPMQTWQPAAGEKEAWREAVDMLVREAAAGPEGAGRLVAAARLAWSRAGDLVLASTLLEQARAAGADDVRFWRERALVATAMGDGATASGAWRAYATQADGRAGVEALVEAARAARDLAGEEAWLTTLVELRKKHGEDATLLALLRDAYRRAGAHEQEAEVLGALAALHGGAGEGPAAAMVQHERIDILDRNLGRPDQAAAVAKEILATDPADTAAFLYLERYGRSTGNQALLANTYTAEAERLLALGANADAAWWFARAARIYRTHLLDEDRALARYKSALAAAPHASDVRHELHSFCEESQRWEELVASLAEEITLVPKEARSFVQYLRARVLEEKLGRADEALAEYRAACEDPAAAPAAETVLRILQARKDGRGIVEFLQERQARLSDPSVVVTALYRMGETCEGTLSDQAGARKHYEAVLDVAPGYLPALEGLERVYTRLEAWAELAAIYEQRALLAEDPATIALQRHRAGSVYDFRLKNEPKAIEQYRLALEAVPDFPASLDAYVRAMEVRDDWAALAGALRAAGASTRDSNGSVSFYYRAGRVLADRTDDLPGAMACLLKSLELSPGFLPAVLLLKELAARQGDWSEYYRLERSQADLSEDLERRHWRLFAAAEAAQRIPEADPGQLVREVLREDPAHVGAVTLAERIASAQGDNTGLAAIYQRLASATQDEGEKVRALVRATELLADAGDGASVVAGIGAIAATAVEGRPMQALARTAEALGQPEAAIRALGVDGAANQVEVARIQHEALGNVDAAATAVQPLLDSGNDARAAVVALQTTRDRALLGRAHRTLALGATDGSVRSMHASTSALLFAAAGLDDDALAMWQVAFDADPRLGRSFDGLKAALVTRKDAAGLAALYGRLPAQDRSGLGDALEEAGDVAGAVEAWRNEMATAVDPLPWSARVERGLAALGDWKGVFELLRTRMATVGGQTRDEDGAKCRWILAEKLAETDEAWEFYQQLHAARPDDVEVLGALARIAVARGDQQQAVTWLDQLSSHAGAPEESARVQRQRGEILVAMGDYDGARSAYVRALDFVHEDVDALQGLRRLAERSGDWQAVVGLVARQAALSHGPVQVKLFAEIAEIWEEKINSPSVAADAWRKVLELDPKYPGARARLLALAEHSKDWKGFLTHAEALLPTLPHAEANVLRRRMATVLSEHLRRDDEALRLLDVASAAPDGDVEAARMLERMYQSRNDWERVVDALQRRAAASTVVAERVEALSRAARIRRETLQDKDGAAALAGAILALDPTNLDALRTRSNQLWEAGDHAAAAELFERLESSEADRDLDDFDAQIESALFYYRYAEALARSGREADALRRYERALELNPTHLPTLEAIGPLFIAREDWPKAEKVFRQLLQLTGGLGNNEQLARVYASLGTVELHVGQIDKAKKRFTKALELRPNDLTALKGLSEVLRRQGDWNNLLNIYNNVIYHTHDPQDVIRAYLSKGLVLDAHLHLPEKAAQHYEKSLAFDPAQPVALLRLGELALRRQDWPEAASLADRGLQLQSDVGAVRAGLHLVRAVAYQACGDDAAARDGFNAAVREDPSVGTELGDIGDWTRAHDLVRTRVQDGRT